MQMPRSDAAGVPAHELEPTGPPTLIRIPIPTELAPLLEPNYPQAVTTKILIRVEAQYADLPTLTGGR